MPGSIKDCSSRIDQTPSPPFTTPLSINTAKWNTKLEPVNPRQKEERTCYKLGTMDQGGGGKLQRTWDSWAEMCWKKSINIASYSNKSSFSKISFLYIYVFYSSGELPHLFWYKFCCKSGQQRIWFRTVPHCSNFAATVKSNIIVQKKRQHCTELLYIYCM